MRPSVPVCSDSVTGQPCALIRPAYVDQIVWKIGVDPTVMGHQVLQGSHVVNGDTPPASIIKLAATLNLEAVAEGVSTRKQLASLRRLRCRYAQGYYFARPQPPQSLNGLLGGQAVANW